MHQLPFFLCSGPNQEFGPGWFQGPNVELVNPAIPVWLSDLKPTMVEDCSLVERYPDLQMTGSEQAPLTATVSHGLAPEFLSQPDWSARRQPQASALSLTADQGYLAMGASANISLDPSGQEPGLEPMSNSLLNGLLDKQLDEVYMLLLNDNLARCNSNMGNSLLHGLVPPPQPSCHLQGTDSLDPSLEEPEGEDSASKVSYLSTHNLVPCSSNFSTPVLRISEAENPLLK